MNASAFAKGGLLQRIITSSAQLLDHAAGVGARVVTQAGPAFEHSNLGQSPETSSKSARHFSIRSLGADLQEYQRTQVLELQWTRRMLPNRVSMTPHFTAHSIMLLPEPQPQHEEASVPDRPQSLLNFTPHSVQLVPTPTGELPVPAAPMMADSVKRKRKLKMKKHKHRKRLKKMRQKNK